MTGPSFRMRWLELVASKHGPPDPGVRHVLHVLSLHMDRDGGSCFPSIALLAEESGMAESTVRRHLKTAEAQSWIRRWVRDTRSGKGWKRYAYQATASGGALKSGGPNASSAQSEHLVRSNPSFGPLNLSNSSAQFERLGIPSSNPSSYPIEEDSPAQGGNLGKEVVSGIRGQGLPGYYDGDEEF